MTDNSTVQMTELQDLIENLVTAVVEQGTSGRFTITQLCKIAEALGVTPASLMAPGNLSKAQAI